VSSSAVGLRAAARSTCGKQERAQAERDEAVNVLQAIRHQFGLFNQRAATVFDRQRSGKLQELGEE
jgi:hypothetical protein